MSRRASAATAKPSPDALLSGALARCRHGNPPPDAVRDMIRAVMAGADPDLRDDMSSDPTAAGQPGRTMLIVAAMGDADGIDGRDRVRIIDAAIRRGADPDLGDANDRTALWHAAHHGRETIVERLITAGASVDMACHNLWTPLHEAVCERHHAVVDRLLRAGADPKARSARGMTPLGIAAGADDRALVHTIATAAGVADTEAILHAMSADVRAARGDPGHLAHILRTVPPPVLEAGVISARPTGIVEAVGSDDPRVATTAWAIAVEGGMDPPVPTATGDAADAAWIAGFIAANPSRPWTMRLLAAIGGAS